MGQHRRTKTKAELGKASDKIRKREGKEMENGIMITPQGLITAGAVIAALVAIFGYYNRIYKFIQQQKKQDEDIKSMKEELTILTYGVLACLKGLKEQGCNGAVSEAIDKTEKYLNQKAHGQI